MKQETNYTFPNHPIRVTATQVTDSTEIVTITNTDKNRTWTIVSIDAAEPTQQATLTMPNGLTVNAIDSARAEVARIVALWDHATEAFELDTEDIEDIARFV